MNIFNGKSLFEGYRPILTEQLLTESNQTNLTKNTVKEKFEKLGIFEAEQLIAIINTESRKMALANTLELNETFIQSLIDKSKEDLGNKTNFYLNEGYHHSLGLKLEENIGLITEQFSDTDFSSIATQNNELDQKSNEVATYLNNYVLNSNNISLLNYIPNVKDQQGQPTCAAFAATSSNEFRLTYLVHKSYRGYIVLSETSIFCEAKKTDGIPFEQGTRLSDIANVIGKIGQAQIRLYPYEGYSANLCSNHNYRQAINSGDLANQKAGIISVNPRSVKALKTALENNHLPYIGIELFESIWNARTNENGFINMPLSGETSQGGHAICLVGYSDDTKLPGGGVFIFKNSWGTSWSFDNILNRQGFGLISYKYIETYCNQAFLTI